MPDRKRGPAAGLRRARSRASGGHGGSVGMGQEQGLRIVPSNGHSPHSLPQIAGSFWPPSPFPIGGGQKPRERVFSVKPTASWMDCKN